MARSSNLFRKPVHCAPHPVLCCLRLRPRLLTLSHPGALRQHSLRLLLAGFSIIQSTSNETASNRMDRSPALFRSRSPLLTVSLLIFLPLATQMFQFAKFEKSKERRLATELGYGFPIGDPWITDALSPHGLSPLKASVLPSQCPGIHPMHSFR